MQPTHLCNYPSQANSQPTIVPFEAYKKTRQIDGLWNKFLNIVVVEQQFHHDNDNDNYNSDTDDDNDVAVVVVVH